LKQPQYRPMSVEQQVMVIYAGAQGFLDDVPLSRVQEFQDKFLSYVDSSFGAIRKTILEKKELAAETESQLKQALSDFKAKVWTTR
ncbi:MAG: F0F1 ATP synthase subunit alpha, partial [Tepidisphaeraceae bacterium]